MSATSILCALALHYLYKDHSSEDPNPRIQNTPTNPQQIPQSTFSVKNNTHIFSRQADSPETLAVTTLISHIQNDPNHPFSVTQVINLLEDGTIIEKGDLRSVSRKDLNFISTGNFIFAPFFRIQKTHLSGNGLQHVGAIILNTQNPSLSKNLPIINSFIQASENDKHPFSTTLIYSYQQKTNSITKEGKVLFFSDKIKCFREMIKGNFLFIPSFQFRTTHINPSFFQPVSAIILGINENTLPLPSLPSAKL